MSAPDPAPATSPSTEWRHWLLAGLLPILLFLPTLRFGFVYDDIYYVQNNPWIRDWSHLGKLLTSMEGNGTLTVATSTAFWRPLRNLAYLIDYSIAGLNPWWFHLMNVLWHGVACVGVRALALRLGMSSIAATLAALVFGMHPAVVESVAWIKERDGVMAAAFAIWSLALALGRGWGTATASMVLGLAAYLSKENTIVLPALLVLARVLGLSRRPAGEFLPLLSALGMLAVAFLAVRAEVVGMTAQREGWPGGTLAGTVWTMAGVYARYVGHVLLPVRLEIDYSHIPVAGPGSLIAWLGAALLVATAAGGWLLRRRWPVLAFGLGAFLLALGPYSNLVPMMQWMAVRFLYLPMLGAALVGGALLGHLWEARERLGQTLGVAVPAGLAVLTLTTLPAWADEDSLWMNAYHMNPDNATVRLAYAQSMVRLGRVEEALKALEDRPGRPPIRRDWEQYWVLRGRIIELTEGIPAAHAFMERERPRYDRLPAGHVALGYLRARMGDGAGAEEAWRRALAIDPFNVAARNNLAELERLRSGGAAPTGS